MCNDLKTGLIWQGQGIFFALYAFHVKCRTAKEMYIYIHGPCSALDSEILLLPNFFAFWLPEVLAASSICC